MHCLKMIFFQKFGTGRPTGLTLMVVSRSRNQFLERYGTAVLGPAPGRLPPSNRGTPCAADFEAKMDGRTDGRTDGRNAHKQVLTRTNTRRQPRIHAHTQCANTCSAGSAGTNSGKHSRTHAHMHTRTPSRPPALAILVLPNFNTHTPVTISVLGHVAASQICSGHRRWIDGLTATEQLFARP